MMNELTGRRILVVEDSPVVAPFTQEVLEELGCIIVGPAGNLASARELAEAEEIDAAILDINIRGDKSFAVCDILDRRDVPFVLTSGYAGGVVPEKWQNRPRLPKPYTLSDVEAALLALDEGSPTPRDVAGA
jgi:CheY-like chemotaxis protein